MVFDTHALEVLALIVTLFLAALATVRLNRPRARIGDRARAVVRGTTGGVVATGAADEAPGLYEQFTQSLANLGNRLPLFNHKQRQQILLLLAWPDCAIPGLCRCSLPSNWRRVAWGRWAAPWPPN